MLLPMCRRGITINHFNQLANTISGREMFREQFRRYHQAIDLAKLYGSRSDSLLNPERVGLHMSEL